MHYVCIEALHAVHELYNTVYIMPYIYIIYIYIYIYYLFIYLNINYYA